MGHVRFMAWCLNAAWIGSQRLSGDAHREPWAMQPGERKKRRCRVIATSWHLLRYVLILLAYNVRTAGIAHPDLVDSAGVDIDTRPGPVGRLLTIRLIRIPQRHLALDDQVRGQAAVRVRRVVGIATCVDERQSSSRGDESVPGRAPGTYGPSVQVKTWSNPHERTWSSCCRPMASVVL